MKNPYDFRLVLRSAYDGGGYEFYRDRTYTDQYDKEPQYTWNEGPHEVELPLPEYFTSDVLVTFTIDNYGEPDTDAPLVNIRSVTINGEPLDHALYSETMLIDHVTAFVDSNPELYQSEDDPHA